MYGCKRGLFFMWVQNYQQAVLSLTPREEHKLQILGS
jgi:hypothetical protein